MVEVTQADRDAGAQTYADIDGTFPIDTVFRDELLSGLHDDDPLIQAFAAHRIAERERCIRIMQDRFPGYANAKDKIAEILRSGE